MERMAVFTIRGIVLLGIGLAVGTVFILNNTSAADLLPSPEPLFITEPPEIVEAEEPDELEAEPTEPPVETAAPSATSSPADTPTPPATPTSAPRQVAPTPTPTVTPTATPPYQITKQIFPVYFCSLLENGQFEWYVVEVEYHDGVPVSETVVSGPHYGGWLPGCPGVELPEATPTSPGAPPPPPDDGGPPPPPTDVPPTEEPPPPPEG